MRTRRRSLVPIQYQLPAAIVLGILFIAILIWRFAPRSPEQSEATAPDAATGAPAEPAPTAETALAALEQELALSESSFPPLPQPPPAPDVRYNPFIALPQSEIVESVPEETGENAIAYLLAPEAPTRDERLAALEITATAVSGDWAMAIVNDRFLRIGDKCSGFEVASIGVDSVVLRDAEGDVAVPIVAPMSGGASARRGNTMERGEVGEQ